MSTYLPGVTDSLPDLNLYKPNIGFLNQMLQTKSAMYQQGASQVKSAYNSVLNAPLTAQGNAEVRDEYMKQAQEKLKNLASADLSMQQNVAQANNVFAPFWQDQDLVQDYSKTRKAQDELMRASALANSSDPKQREQFWQTGVDYVNLGLRELQMAKRGDGSISKVRMNSYTPFFDVQGMLDARAKEQGLTIKVANTSGGFIKEIVNGDGSVTLYEEWAARQLANSPQAMDTFRVEGTVNFKNKAFNIMEQSGGAFSYDQAKTMIAGDFMTQQKKSYTESSTNLTKNIAEINARLEGLKSEYSTRVPTDQEKQDYLSLAQRAKSLTESRDDLDKKVSKYSDTNSEDYQKEFNSIVDNGESFFAEHRRDSFIRNYARTRALNTQVNLEIDPVAKFNAEMQRDFMEIQYNKSLQEQKLAIEASEGGSGGRGTGIGSRRSGMTATELAQANLDAPVSIGLTVHGNDPISSYNRMQATKENLMDQTLTNSLSIIASSKIKVLPEYVQYIERAMKTGKFTVTPSLKAEHERLQAAGVIPKNVKLGANVSATYESLYKQAEDYFTAQPSNMPEGIIQKMVIRENAGNLYRQLKEVEQNATKQIIQDESFREIRDNSGKIVSKSAYMKKRFNTANVEEFIKRQTLLDSINATSLGGSSAGTSQGYAQMWRAAEKQYEGLVDKTKGTLGTIMDPYIKQEGAFIGRSIRYSTDLKEDKDKAQYIAEQIMAPQNLTNGALSTTDGLVPLNVAQLEELGAKRGDLVKIMKALPGNVGDQLSHVDLSKVGSTGEPSAILRFNPAELRKVFTDKNSLSEDTWNALGAGIEIKVTNAVNIPEFKSEFVSSGVDQLLLNKQNEISAPPFLKKMGMDYTVTRDPYGNQYVVDLEYPELVNGQWETKTETRYVPINASLQEIAQETTGALTQVYNINAQLRKNQTPPEGAQSFSAFLKENNLK